MTKQQRLGIYAFVLVLLCSVACGQDGVFEGEKYRGCMVCRPRQIARPFKANIELADLRYDSIEGGAQFEYFHAARHSMPNLNSSGPKDARRFTARH